MRTLAELKALPGRRATAFPIGLARIGVGMAAILGAVEVSSELRRLHDPRVIRLPRSDLIPVLPEPGVSLFLTVWVVAAVAFAAGWKTRSAGAVLIGVLSYVMLLDHQLYSNHLYLMMLMTVLLTLARSGATLSLDARREGSLDSIPAWPVALIRLQVSIVYLFATAAKLNLYFLSGVVLRVHIRLPGIEAAPPWVFTWLALASVATEAFLAVAFWNRRLRPLAFVVGIGFHLTILATIRLVPDLLTFALLMASAYLAFFSSITPVGGETGPPDVDSASAGGGAPTAARPGRSRYRPG